MMNRRNFLAAGLSAFPLFAVSDRFRPSLAEGSLNRSIQSKKITNLDFPGIAQKTGCEGVEFVSTLWADTSVDYISSLINAVSAASVKPVLIRVDDQGWLGSIDSDVRQMAVQKHITWADIARVIKCEAIRVNPDTDVQPQSASDIDNFIARSADSLTQLCAYASNRRTNVLVENHGGVTSDMDVLVRLVNQVNMPNFRLLPDFGNFPTGVDKYAAIRKMMPYAKAVCFKCFFEGPNNTEANYDVAQMFKIVEESKYKGFIGIEYAGAKLSEMEGIQAARAAMTKLGLVG